MSADPAEALSLDELERYGRVWGQGNERRALCPYCDHPKRDREHATLAFNATTGAWHCHRCGRSGLLAEHWTKREDEPLRLRHRGRRRSAPSAPPPPTPAELAEEAESRERLRRMWGDAVPILEPASAPGAAYLSGRRGIPLDVAAAARVRFAADWYGRPSLVFPVQNGEARLVAADGRYIDGRADPPKGRSCSHKTRGVFVALPGAIDADGVSLCEGPLTALSMAACGYPAVSLGGQNAPPWLLRRLALRRVIVALDEGETKTEEADAAICTALARVGAKPYRLRLAPRVDVNDYLQTHGLAATRARLDEVICGALLQ